MDYIIKNVSQGSLYEKEIYHLLSYYSFNIYLKVIKPYKQEQDIKAELRSKWNINVNKVDKLRVIKSSRPQWYGEHHKSILFTLDNSSHMQNYIRDNNLYLYKMNSDSRRRIIEIEKDLILIKRTELILIRRTIIQLE